MEQQIQNDYILEMNNDEYIYYNDKKILRRSINEDVLVLKDLLVQEKLTESILRYESVIVDNLSDLIKHQQDLLQNFEQPYENNINQYQQSFLIFFYKLDIERINYLLKNYLRTRLTKIQNYADYIEKNNLFRLLSQPEKEFLINYLKLKQNYIDKEFLSKIPHQFRNTDKINENSNPFENISVKQPNENQFVFVKIIKEISPQKAFDCGIPDDLKKGDILLIQYKQIKILHQQEDNFVQLI